MKINQMNYQLNNIAGYEKEKLEVKKICDLLNNRERLSAVGAKLPKGIIIYGPTGTGKTLFVKVLASLSNLPLEVIKMSNASTSFSIGKQVSRIFKKANKKKEPTLVYFDEIDKVLPNEYSDTVTDTQQLLLAQLLTLIDGIDGSNVFFIASCNRYSSLPDSLVRAGRMIKNLLCLILHILQE